VLRRASASSNLYFTVTGPLANGYSAWTEFSANFRLVPPWTIMVIRELGPYVAQQRAICSSS